LQDNRWDLMCRVQWPVLASVWLQPAGSQLAHMTAAPLKTRMALEHLLCSNAVLHAARTTPCACILCWMCALDEKPAALCEPEPCNPVPCYPVPCYPVPCYPVPCNPVPCYPVPCYPEPCKPVPCKPEPCKPVPCKPVPCKPVPCKPVPCKPEPCRPLSPALVATALPHWMQWWPS
jgi:hypothetical protein